MRFGILLAWAALAGPSGLLWAQGGTAVDGAASLAYPLDHWTTPEGPADLLGVDTGGDVVYATSWWYRLTTGDTREHRFPQPDTETYSNGQVQAHWNNVGGLGFSADETTWVIDHEGPSGGIKSTMKVTSLGSTVDLMLFHYLDLAVGGSFGGDSGVLLAGGYMKFTDGSASVRYSAASNSLWAHEVKPYAGGLNTLLAKLNDGAVDDLSNTGLPFPADDPVAAYQFRAYVTGASPTNRATVSVLANLPRDQIKCNWTAERTGFPELFFQSGNNVLGWMMRRTEKLSSFSYPTPVAGSLVVGCDDFTGAYRAETVTHDPASGQLYIGSHAVGGAPPLATSWKVAATGRLSPDSQPDVLWRNTVTQKLLVWVMSGRDKVGELVPTPDQAVDGNWEVVGLGDFDNDGNNDFLWYNQTSGRLVIWYMSGSLVRTAGAFTNPPAVANNNWKALAVGDYGRGTGGLFDTPDILWQNDTSQRVVVWFMDHSGNRTWGTFTNPDTAGVGWTLAGPR